MYDTRIDIRYYDKKYPGHRLILDPVQVERYGWTWKNIYDAPYSSEFNMHLYCLIELDNSSDYHFLINFQHSQSMKETVNSLPSRIHVSGTGTNTFQIPIYDLMPTLELLATHDNYDIIVHNDVYKRYDMVVEEDTIIKSLADITTEDKEEIAKIRQVLQNSKILNPDYKPYNFQVAGIAMMLHIYGVADKLVPGVSNIRKLKAPSVLTSNDAIEDVDLAKLVEEYINS